MSATMSPDREVPTDEDPKRLNGWQQFEKNMARWPLARMATAVPRTVGWAVRTVSSEASQLPGFGEIPVSPRLMAHVAMDESIVALAAGPSRFPRRDDYQRVAEELREAADQFDASGFLDDPRSYHLDPPRLRSPRTSVGWAMGQRYERLSWDSEYEVRPDEPGGERWMSYEANRTASAWILDHRDGPRPWVVAIHGFGTGAPFADMFTFRAQHLHKDLGFNLAAIVLPVHGSRRPTRVGGEAFLGIDMMNAVHGMAQSLWDIRRLVSWVEVQEPSALGVFGVSLGGYLTSLAACFVPSVDIALAGIPVVDFPDLFRRHSPKHVAERAETHGIVNGVGNVVHRVVSPLHLSPVVPTASLKIFAGLGDRMAVPEHAAALWRHWEEPEICWFPGNHVGYLWSPEVASFTDRVLGEGLGVVGLDPDPFS